MKLLKVVILSLFIISCEKNVNIVPDNLPPKLVVDAQIETNEAPVVVLTKSMNYFSNINPTILNNLFVRNATVTVSNGSQTHVLREYPITVGTATFYVYTKDFANPSTAFVGEEGKTYQLTIQTNGETYTASTTIPFLTKKIDSVWWKVPPPGVDTTFAIVMARITDPPLLGNYIRYFTKRNSEVFLPGGNSVFDDQVINGVTYDVQVSAGLDRNRPRPSIDSLGYFFRGDTVTLKFCNIDKATYDFWNTWEFAYSAIGNPFASPIKVLGNISNNALGAFCGYATQFKQVVIPK